MDNSIPSIHSPYCTPLVQDDLCIPTEEDLEAKRKAETVKKIEEEQRDTSLSSVLYPFTSHSPYFSKNYRFLAYRWLLREVDFVVNNPDHNMECQVYGELIAALKLTAIDENQYRHLYGLLYQLKEEDEKK